MSENMEMPRGFDSCEEQPATMPDHGGGRSVAIGPSLRDAEREHFAPSIPGYEIVARLGRGGMGVVYKAWQFSLKRFVALKMLREGAWADGEQRARFRGEAEAAARLRHPHIVQIHEIGEHDGWCYLALEYIEGGSLAERLRQGPLSRGEAVRLVEQVARAVHAAHEAGVIHRDLTPANILLAVDGSPRISDFGLAKRLDSDATQTYSGVILGTPAYMAPEQAAGQSKHVGVSTDVYSLGAILYELLAGRPPFWAPSPVETMNLVLSEEPISARRYDARLPRDLDTICLKCLQKETRRRYASAEELAEDLRRWQSGEPIRARRSSPWERAAKWTRRRPAAAALFAVLLLSFLGAVFGGIWHTLELEQALQYAREQQAEAWRQEQRVLEREQELEQQLHALDVRIAQRLWRHGHVSQALQRLERHKPPLDTAEPQRFDWCYLWRLCQAGAPARLPSTDTEARAAAFSPDGTLLAVAHGNGTICLWAMPGRRFQVSLRGHEGPIDALSFTPDGRTLFSVGEDRTVRAWDVERRTEARCFRETDSKARRWLPSPDGRFRATVRDDATVALYRAEDDKRAWLASAPEKVEVLAFSRDGRLLACGCRNGSVRLWDTTSGDECGWFEHASTITALALASDGRVAAVAESNGLVTLHVRSGGTTVRFRSHEGAVRCLAFAPCHGLLASVGDDNIVRIWETGTGELRNVLRGHQDRITAAAFAPDRCRLATVSRDGFVHLWDPLRSQDRQTLLAPAPAITRLAWAPDGRIAATVSPDHSITLWDAVQWCPLSRLTGHFGDVQALAFSPDSRTLATASADRTVQLWDVADRRARARLIHAAALRAVVFLADGKTLVTGEESGTVALWDAVRGVRLRDLARHNGPLRCLACSPDGRLLASASEDRTVQLWQTDSWERRRTLQHSDPVLHAAFHTDGRMLAATTTGGQVSLWETAEGSRLRDLTGPVSPYESACFAPDGRTLILAGRNAALAVWDVSNRAAPRSRHGLWDGNEVVGVAFAPQGTALAAAHRDGRISLWDSRNWTNRQTVGPARGPVRSLEFSSDGAALSAVCGTTLNWARHTRRLWPGSDLHMDSWLPGDCDEALLFWDTTRGAPRRVLPSSSAIARPALLASAPDGRTLATAQDDGTVWLWDLAANKRRAVLSTCRHADWWRMNEKVIFSGIPARPERMAPIRALAFTPDSRTLAVVAADGNVQLWNTDRAVRESILPGDHRDTTCLAIAPDGRTLATHRRGTLELWDLQTRQCWSKPLHPGARIRCLAFSSDGRWLVSGASDCSVKLCDLHGERDFLLSGHTDSVSAARFAPDGRTLATASFDRTLRIWDVATAQEVLQLDGHSGKVHCLAFTADGKTLASGGETPHGSGEIYLWHAAPSEECPVKK
ncbi:MAG TPA: protein kinase [Gemmataceae bacterium]|nr:protein kinase [Gemmataceae bacterium]